MAQFRVEFVLDPSSGKYLAEMYHPDRDHELLVRTEARYATPAAAVLGVVQLFKGAMRKLPKKPRKKNRSPKKAKRKQSGKRRR